MRPIILFLAAVAVSGCGARAVIPVAYPQFDPVTFNLTAEGSGWSIDTSISTDVSGLEAIALEAEMPFSWYGMPGELSVTLDYPHLTARICGRYGNGEPTCATVPLRAR